MPRRAGAALAAGVALSALAATPAAGDPAARGAAYVVSRQAPGGAFFAPDAPADGVAEALASVVAGGLGGHAAVARALAYLGREGPARAAERPAYAGRIVMGLAATGRDPRAFGGTDYVRHILDGYNPLTGSYETQVYADALAVLGLVAAREPVPERAIEYLRVNRCPAGGFAHEPGCLDEADVDTTALVVCALVGAGVGRTDDAVEGARSFLRASQNADAGWGLGVGDPTNANSTGLALSALAGLREDPGAWRRGDGDPVDALVTLQLPSGAWRYRSGHDRPNDYATVQAIPGAALLAYPIRPRPAVASVGRAPAVASRGVAAGHPAATPGGRAPAGIGVASRHDLPRGDALAAASPAGESPQRGLPIALSAALLGGAAAALGARLRRTR